MVSSACHANAETVLGLEVMDEVAAEYPDEVRYEDVNVMCELAMLSKHYSKVFDVSRRLLMMPCTFVRTYAII